MPSSRNVISETFEMFQANSLTFKTYTNNNFVSLATLLSFSDVTWPHQIRLTIMQGGRSWQPFGQRKMAIRKCRQARI